MACRCTSGIRWFARFLSLPSLPVVLISCLASIPAAWAANPSPPFDGWVVWGSNRVGGRHELFIVKADGSGLKQLTREGGRFPTWSPDGSWISYLHGDGSGHVIRYDGSGDKRVCPHLPRFWMPDGSGLVCPVKDETEWRIYDLDGGKDKLLLRKASFSQLADATFRLKGLSADGRFGLGWTDRFKDGYVADNGPLKSPYAAAIIDRKNPSLLFFIGPGCQPSAAPIGYTVVHVHGGQPASAPDIYRMDLRDRKTRSSYRPEMNWDRPQWGHEYFPRISTDNRWLVYGATTGCHHFDECDYEIFLHPLGADKSARVRLTHDSHNDQWPHMFVGKPGTAPAKPTLEPLHASSGAVGLADVPAEQQPEVQVPETSGCAMASPSRSSGVGAVLPLALLLLGLLRKRR